MQRESMRTIVWDLDDVLNNLMQAWLEQYWLPDHPNCRIRYDDLLENPPHRILGIELNEYLDSLDAFRHSETARELIPNPEILGWFNQYGYQFRHMVLTATPLHCAPIMSEWVLRNFGQWVRSFNFVPSERVHQPTIGYDRSKIDFLNWWGKADIFIDDNPYLVKTAQENGIQSYLLSQPWNQNQQTTAEFLSMLCEC
jgi:hypothetical protein